MNQFASILSALVLLCIQARAQTQAIPAPLGGHIPIMSIDASGQQHILAPSYRLDLDPIPASATCVTISFPQNDAPHGGIENTNDFSADIVLNLGVQHVFTWRRWLYRADYSWQGGYWNEAGLWVDHSDVPEGTWQARITGIGVQYPFVSSGLSPFDGDVNWAGSSGNYWSGAPCGLWATMHVTDPYQVERFKHPDQSGKVHIYYSPRALIGCHEISNAHHWYPPTATSQGSYAWGCNYTTSIGFILVDWS